MKDHHSAVAATQQGLDNFFSKAFGNIDIVKAPFDIAQLKKNAMLACTHRSHVDYMFLGHQLHKMGVPNLRFAAGDNLTKLPILGKKFTSYGAFSVARSQGAKKNYVRNLFETVITMLADGDNIIVFPEGGRSYHGGMSELKTGIIGAGVMAQARRPDETIWFLPSAISYEYLPEVAYLDMLEQGKAWRRGTSLFDTLRGNTYYFGADIIAFSRFIVGTRFGVKHGAIHLDIGQPFAVKDVVDFEQSKNADIRDEFSANRAGMQQLSQVLFRKFLSLYCLLPMHATAYILKQHGDCTVSRIAERIQQIVDECEKKALNTRIFKTMTQSEIVEKGIEQITTIGAAEKKGATVYCKRQSLIDYHAASLSSIDAV